MDRELKIENAIIDSTMLGMEDHGILTCNIGLSGNGWGCGFGGYTFSRYDQALKKRIGMAYGMKFIERILEVVGVSKWEDLKGKHVRCKTEGLGGGIAAIGNILKDQWFDPKAEKDFLLKAD